MSSDSFMVRTDYAELAKQINSICGAVSTVFLFARLWAKTTHYNGLWRDDIFRELFVVPFPSRAPRHGTIAPTSVYQPLPL